MVSNFIFSLKNMLLYLLDINGKEHHLGAEPCGALAGREQRGGASGPWCVRRAGRLGAGGRRVGGELGQPGAAACGASGNCGASWACCAGGEGADGGRRYRVQRAVTGPNGVGGC